MMLLHFRRFQWSTERLFQTLNQRIFCCHKMIYFSPGWIRVGNHGITVCTAAFRSKKIQGEQIHASNFASTLLYTIAASKWKNLINTLWKRAC